MQTPDHSYKQRPPRLERIFAFYDSPLYFVTICAFHRRPLFARNEVLAEVRQFGRKGFETKQIALGRFVLMPDHIHLFVRGGPDFSLSQWVKLFKQMLGKRLQACGVHGPYWQEGFFDHLVRGSESYGQKWEYVWQNPVRAGLSASAADWPYQGEAVRIAW